MGSNAVTITTGSNQNITLTPNGTGVIAANRSISFTSDVTLTRTSATHLEIASGGSISSSNVHMGNAYANSLRYQGDSSLVATLGASGAITFASGIGMPSGAAITFGTQGNITNRTQAGGGGIIFTTPSGALRLDPGINLQFSGSSSSTFTDYTVFMPSAQGGANQIIYNYGSGNLGWVSPVTASAFTVSDITSVIPGTLAALWEKSNQSSMATLTIAPTDLTAGATNVPTFNYVATATIGGSIDTYRVTLIYYSFGDTQYHIGMATMRVSGANIVLEYRTNGIIGAGGVGSFTSGTRYKIPALTFVVKLI